MKYPGPEADTCTCMYIIEPGKTLVKNSLQSLHHKVPIEASDFFLWLIYPTVAEAAD